MLCPFILQEYVKVKRRNRKGSVDYMKKKMKLLIIL